MKLSKTPTIQEIRTYSEKNGPSALFDKVEEANKAQLKAMECRDRLRIAVSPLNEKVIQSFNELSSYNRVF